jgi:hypothetical protein
VIVQNDGNFVSFTSTSSADYAHVVAFVAIGGPSGSNGSGVAYVVEPDDSPYPGAIINRIMIDVARLANDPTFIITIDFFSEADNAPPTYPPANVLVLVANGSPQLLNGIRDSSGDGIFLPAQVWAQSDVPTSALHASWGKIKASYR